MAPPKRLQCLTLMFLAFLAFGTPQVAAQTALGAGNINPDSWCDTLPWTTQTAAPIRLAVLSALSPEPKNAAIDTDVLRRLVYLELMQDSYLKAFLRLNRTWPMQAPGTGKPNAPVFWQLLRTDVVVHVQAEKVDLWSRASSGEMSKLLSKPKSSKPLSETVAEIMYAGFGYNGVVVARKGDLVLALTPDLRKKPLTQALLYANSKTPRLDANARKGSSLLDLEVGGRRCSTFRINIPAPQPDAYDFGQKLLIETAS